MSPACVQHSMTYQWIFRKDAVNVYAHHVMHLILLFSALSKWRR